MKAANRFTVLRCAVCGACTTQSRYHVLHVGRRHPGALLAEDLLAFEAAVAAETAWLARVRRHIRSGFTVLPLALFYVLTAIVLYEMGGNPAWAVAVLPGFIAFGALMYGMTYSRAALRDSGVVWKPPGP